MQKRNKNKRISLFAYVTFAIFIIIEILLGISKSNINFADTVNSTVSSAFRKLMASISSPLPFSVFEVLIALIPLWVVLIIIFAVRSFKRRRGARFIINLASVVLLLISGHNLALGIGYNTTPLSERLSLDSVPVTKDNLAAAMISLRDEVNELAPRVAFSDGETRYGEDMDALTAEILDSYSDFSREYSFPDILDSRAKPIHFSNVMSYFRITGIYTYYTGEANVNIAYPDYDIAFTTAHELSHQRGILRENEANFMAYLICARADSDYLKYSASLSLYEYISSALYRTDKELYREISAGLCDVARADIKASSAVTQKYGNTPLADISNTINDLFLKSNGTEGVISYSMVVKLAISYFSANGRI